MAIVLMGHDFAEARNVYASHLEAAGFEVLTASDALMVIDLALKHHPDVVIIDDGLPELTGWELVRVLKLHPHLRRAPILMLAGLLSESARAAEESGADGIVAKPCSGDDLVNEVRRALRAAQRR